MRLLLVLFALVTAFACQRDDGTRVTSHLDGSVVVADTAAQPRPSDFSVLVLDAVEGGDTLGAAAVGAEGTFALRVTAPRRGIYPLVLLHRGRPVRVDDIAVADGDSATVRYTLPPTVSVLRIRSRENDAWMAFRNAKAHYDEMMREALSQPDPMRLMEQTALQTSSILWSHRDVFPGTVAAERAETESITLLDGWNDSLLVARAREILPSSEGYVTTARAARRAEARLHGQKAAIRLLEAYRDREGVAPHAQAALQAEIVTARFDSLQGDAALVAARELRKRYPASPWADWAERAQHEATHLLPGQRAPAFTAVSDEGRRVSLDSLRGRFVVLEFFAPTEEAYRQQLGARLGLQQALGEAPVTFVSVSLDPDSLMSRAFFSQVALPGPRIVTTGGLESPLARQFNVRVLPTRYLIGPDGTVEARYIGPMVPQLAQDLLTLIRSLPPKPAA